MPVWRTHVSERGECRKDFGKGQRGPEWENTARDFVARDMHTGDLVETGSPLCAEPTPLVGAWRPLSGLPGPVVLVFPRL